jgi:hypothetical protein
MRNSTEELEQIMKKESLMDAKELFNVYVRSKTKCVQSDAPDCMTLSSPLAWHSLGRLSSDLIRVIFIRIT